MCIRDSYKGTNLFTEGELTQIAAQLTVTAEWLEKQGSEFVLFIAPNKETVYGEDYLPAYYKKMCIRDRIRTACRYFASP